jgi:hypothetical protein
MLTLPHNIVIKRLRRRLSDNANTINRLSQRRAWDRKYRLTHRQTIRKRQRDQRKFRQSNTSASVIGAQRFLSKLIQLQQLDKEMNK